MVSTASIVPTRTTLIDPNTISINGLVVPGGAFVVLTTQLLNRTKVLGQACAEQHNRSSLVKEGRAVMPHDPDVTLPALYIAGRDLKAQNAAASPKMITAHQTAIHLTMHCGM
jgi:hypothetical protein